MHQHCFSQQFDELSLLPIATSLFLAKRDSECWENKEEFALVLSIHFSSSDLLLFNFISDNNENLVLPF